LASTISGLIGTTIPSIINSDVRLRGGRVVPHEEQ